MSRITTWSIQGGLSRAALALCVASASAIGAVDLSHCEHDKECLVDLPGLECADGTPSYFTVTKREGAKDVLVYLSGGGACWSQGTCEQGYARPLTRVEPSNDWNTGEGIHSKQDQANPFGRDYHIVHVPYCTGDVYTGDRVADYGTAGSPYVIRHSGYRNVQLTLEAVSQSLETPERAVFVGCSAGGIGVYYHLRNFDKAFPSARKYVISDAGTPFKPPYLNPTKYRNIMTTWGADKTLPEMGVDAQAASFGDVIRYNTQKHPDVRFALISSYRDFVMSFFALTVGSASPMTAVKETIIDVSNNDIGLEAPHQKVFYIESSKHCHSGTSLSSVSSLGKSLSAWLHDMVEERGQWDNVRPDLRREVQSAADANDDPRPRTVEEVFASQRY